jgi:hypothetical protein
MKRRSWKTTGLWACAMLMITMAPGLSAAEAASSSAAAWPEAALSAQKKQESFMIKVVDAETGRGIPLVELMTTNNIKYYTDSAGNVAFDEPGLMNQSVFFHL